MIWLRWLPWKFVVRRVARAHGFLDPIALLARLRGFSQPSEVAEPIELLRAGVVLHARGLINSRVIQHNLDWLWPYWVERQFDPNDEAFIPRAFSLTHINLTHRNWTAIGLPDWPDLPIVDPRGLVTPHLDGWSLDGWIVTNDGRALLPSRAGTCQQGLDLENGFAVTTRTVADDLDLSMRAYVVQQGDSPVCRIELEARAATPAWAVLALRPYNPEGISPVHKVALSDDRAAWSVDGRHAVEFSAPAERHHVSDFRAGDVYIHLNDLDDQDSGTCDVGMTTAAALFRIAPGESRRIVATVPLPEAKSTHGPTIGWPETMSGRCELSVPDARFQKLYDAALRTLVLHSPGDVYPGPYTYKRFWFRDAAFIIHALLCAGFADRAERALDRFPARQNAFGYFHSQDGEWDSNGEALWILHRFCELTGRAPKPAWARVVDPGARWIIRKRLPESGDSAHAGLFPPGFSAEHLGLNDYYYWDDFWGVAGLRAASSLSALVGRDALAEEYMCVADSFAAAIDHSLSQVSARLGRPAMPASPHRRLDAGAIGSLAVGYPLQQWRADDPRLLDTVAYLLSNCFVGGGFFQDMIHSGINAYLTLHVAQVLLRAGDPRHFELMSAVAALATSTGQWPEAIHPRTGGGCMGDGQHVWAAADWVMAVRNCFIREESDGLVLASGIPRSWLDNGQVLRFGPTPTGWGEVSLTVEPRADGVIISWRGDWRGAAPPIEVRLAGYELVGPAPDEHSVRMVRGVAA
jgi:hypothetical protein